MHVYTALGCLIQGVVILIAISGTFTDTLSSDACQTNTCRCYESTGVVDCSNATLSLMPEIPKWVQVLTLASNSFTVIQSSIFYSNRDLKMLNFENNQLAVIETDAFHNLYKLERLILKDNRLTEIKSGDFSHLPELRILDLRNNRLRSIAEDAFSLVLQIANVNLNGNRLLCDCTTARLYSSLPTLGVLEMAQCINFENKLIATVVKEHLGECAEGFSTKQDYKVDMNILRPWDDDYRDKKSDKYKDLSETIQNELDVVLTDRPRSDYAFTSTQFIKQGEEIQAVLQMLCTLPSETSVTWYRDQIYFLIREAVDTEDFSFGFDTSAFTITGENFCSNTIPRKVLGVGLVSWESVLPGQTAEAKCPENPDQITTIECDSNGHRATWEAPNITMCRTPSNRTNALEDLVTKPITNKTLGVIADALVDLTQDISDFKHREVSLVSEVTQNCLTAPGVPVLLQSASQLIASVNKMLAVDSDTLVNAELDTNATTRLVQSVERVGNKVEGTAEGVKLVQPQLGVLVTKPPTEKTGLLFETVGDVGEDLNDARMSVNTSGSSPPDLSAKVAAVHLPSSIFANGSNTTNIHFAVYNNASFFLAAEIANQSRSGNISRENSSPYVLNSRVVSAKVGKLDLKNLKDPVTVTLRHVNNHLKYNSSKHVCVYWDYDLPGWSAEGCKLSKVTSSRDDTTTCECDHLTNFALLLDIYGTGDTISDLDKTILSFISYIGIAVSATGLVLTLLTYFSFRRMLRDNPSKILVNLCVALLGIIVSFTFTTQVFVRNNFIACKFFAALTHYFLLATMAWMSVEAFYMYIAIVRVFHTYYSKFLLKCCLIGWGLPLVAVGITVGISRDNYGLQGEICWLPRIPFFAAVLAPVALTLLLNGVAFGLVINQLRQMDSRKLDKSKRSNILSRLRGAISIMVLLGLTWLFAFAAVGPSAIVFTYLFAICNSLQGLFIFIFYCLLKKDAQQNWMNCLGCVRPGSASSSRDTMSYSTRSEVKPKGNRVKPLGDEEYPDEQSSPGYIKRKSCFGCRPDTRKPVIVSQQSNLTTSTTDSSTLVEPF